jgi:hypothetical protein
VEDGHGTENALRQVLRTKFREDTGHRTSHADAVQDWLEFISWKRGHAGRQEKIMDIIILTEKIVQSSQVPSSERFHLDESFQTAIPILGVRLAVVVPLGGRNANQPDALT